MKYKPEFPVTLAPEQVEADLQGARNVGKVRLGQEFLFFSRFAGSTFMPYTEVKHAYLRQEEVTAKMCCGRANFDQFYLMILGSDGVLRKHQVNTLELGRAALDHIAQRNPDALIGYQKPATAEAAG